MQNENAQVNVCEYNIYNPIPQYMDYFQTTQEPFALSLAVYLFIWFSISLDSHKFVSKTHQLSQYHQVTYVTSL